MSAGGEDHDADRRGLQVAVVLLAAFVLGLCAGVLSWLGGTSVPAAVLVGCGSFGGIVILILAILHFMRGG
jgi:hypothetical protein